MECLCATDKHFLTVDLNNLRKLNIATKKERGKKVKSPPMMRSCAIDSAFILLGNL